VTSLNQASHAVYEYGQVKLYQADCLEWMAGQAENSFHACVTDPPYGLVEYTETQQVKLRKGRGGVWRIPPSYDGHTRSPLPRFTTLTGADLKRLQNFFQEWGEGLRRILVPGAHVIVAANPLVSHLVGVSLAKAGLERRGEIVRLVQTLRGGDRPKNAHKEFPQVSVMPRSQWEPWVLFRKFPDGTIADNLRKWRTGGLRRVSDELPFGDVIRSAPTRSRERELAGHPSLKPQDFLRRVVRAALPMGEGVILDPFAGSGSTLAAAQALGYDSVGVEFDPAYIEIARKAIPELARFDVDETS
jgi:DNA modification methylase